MKKILFLSFLIILPITLWAQNPDGKYASLHITPSVQWGSSDFFRNYAVWYPASLSYDEQTVVYKDTGAINYPRAFGIDVLLKIPTSSYLTISIAYSYAQRFEEDNVYAQYWSINGRMHKISLTASIYNLFSVY